MKGKHGKGAAVRHDIAELKARAEKAERRLANITAEYDAYRESTEREAAEQRQTIHALKHGDAAKILMPELKKALDDAAARLTERDNARREKADAERTLKKAQEEFRKLFYAAQKAYGYSASMDLLISAGLARKSSDGKRVYCLTTLTQRIRTTHILLG